MGSKRWLTVGTLAGGAVLGGLWGYSRWAVNRHEDRYLAEVPRPGRVAVVNGVAIHYVEQGQGKALILIHGLGASTYNFRHTLLEMSRHFRTIALDLPGFGLSERPTAYDYSLTNQAHTVIRLMDHLGIERAHILGHSMGGMVAARLAARWPERVDRLILVASPVHLNPPRLLGLGLLAPFWQTAVGIIMAHRRIREKIWRDGFYDQESLTNEIMEQYFLPSRIKGNSRSLVKMAAAARRDPPPDLSQIVCPTLILWGENDHNITSPEVGRKLQQRLPNARLVLIPRAAHMLLEERPQETNQAIRDFLLEEESITSPRPAGVPRDSVRP